MTVTNCGPFGVSSSPLLAVGLKTRNLIAKVLVSKLDMYRPSTAYTISAYSGTKRLILDIR